MQIVRTHHHDHRPLIDLFQVGVAIGALFATLRSLFAWRPPMRDTSIAWENGETEKDNLP